MILSLNICKLSSDSIENVEQKLFDYLEKNIKSKNDIVFLHEFPYENSNLENKLSEKYVIFKPYGINKPLFITVALVKKTVDSFIQFENIQLQNFILSQKNRILFILKPIGKQQYNLIIGAHAPTYNSKKFSSVYNFWESFIDLMKKINAFKCLNGYGYDKQIKDILIVGDLNVFYPGTEQKRLFYKLLSVGFLDLWIESNKNNEEFTHLQSRIDYGLVSDDAFKKYSIEIDHTTKFENNGFTDHSAIKIYKKR